MIDKELYDNYLTTGQVDKVEAISKNNLYCEYLYKNFFQAVSKQAHILDLACGYGEVVYFFENKGFENIKGVEISEELVALSKKLGVKNVMHGDIYDYLNTVADKSIQVFVMKDIIEHFEVEELTIMLKAMKSKLADNGFIIGHAPNGSGIFGMLIRYNDLTHKIAYTRKSLEQLSRICGYSRTEVYEDKPLTKGIKGLVRRLSWKILKLPFRLFYYIETGHANVLLSQNITFKISK